MKSILQELQSMIRQVEDFLRSISSEQYTAASANLSGGTIGKHIRHCIEILECLEQGYACGTVNYGNRKRDTTLEQNKDAAMEKLKELFEKLPVYNKRLLLEYQYDRGSERDLPIETNYVRELIYIVEHTVHHLAQIRMAAREFGLGLAEGFGVASSTLQYQQACVR